MSDKDKLLAKLRSRLCEDIIDLYDVDEKNLDMWKELCKFTEYVVYHKKADNIDTFFLDDSADYYQNAFCLVEEMFKTAKFTAEEIEDVIDDIYVEIDTIVEEVLFNE